MKYKNEFHGLASVEIRITCGGYLCRDTRVLAYKSIRVSQVEAHAIKALKAEEWTLLDGLWYCKQCIESENGS